MPTAAVAAELPRRQVERRIRADLGWRVVGWTELGTGSNNRLVRLDLDGAPPLLVKFYARDRWDRLGPEYAALDYLARQGAGDVPRPFLRDDEHLYGVYSFEQGERREPAALGTTEAAAAARLAATLHASPPGGEGDLAPANAACVAHADQIRLIEARLGAFEADAYAQVRDLPFARGLRAAVERLVAAAVDGLTEDTIARPLPRHAWRLNTYDYGPHNWLFRADGGVTVVDFEGAGWDDPARMIMGCASHPGSEGLSVEASEVFLGTYAQACGLSDDEITRYQRVGRLYDIEWATVYAAAATPEAVVAKRFGTPGFDLAAHLEACVAKLRLRLERAERGDVYQFRRRLD